MGIGATLLVVIALINYKLNFSLILCNERTSSMHNGPFERGQPKFTVVHSIGSFLSHSFCAVFQIYMVLFTVSEGSVRCSKSAKLFPPMGDANGNILDSTFM